MEEDTGVTPDALLKMPRIFGAASDVVDAYKVLSRTRSAGMVPNPIQLSEILAYFELFGKPCLPVDMFIDLIGVMDSKYLELSSGNGTGGNS